MLLKTLFLRPALHDRMRLLATILGVAIGVAALVSTVLSSKAAVGSLREGVGEIAGEARLEITAPGGLDETILPALRPLAADAAILPILEEFAPLPVLNDTVRVLGVDPLADGAARGLNFVEGELESHLSDRSAQSDPSDDFKRLGAALKLLRGEGVAISEGMAGRLGIRPGNAIELIVRAKRRALPIVATFRPHRFASVWDRVVIVDIALAQEIFGRVGSLDRIELAPRPGVDLEALRRRAVALAPAPLQVEEPERRAGRTGRMVRALDFNLTALSGISLLVGATLVAITLATSVVRRRAIIALLRSLGATRWQIVRTVLIEASTIGLAGGAAGAALGYLGARASLAGARATYAVVIPGAPGGEIRLPASLAFAAVAVGLFASLAASTLPALEAAATPPIQGLRSERPMRMSRRSWRRMAPLSALLMTAAWALASAPAWGGLPIASLSSALAILALAAVWQAPLLDLAARLGGAPIVRSMPPVRLAVAALSAGRRRASWATAGIAMAAGLAVSIGVMVDSFRDTVVAWSKQSFRADLWIRPRAGVAGLHAGRLPPEIVEVARGLFGGGAADPFHEAPAFLKGQPVTLGASDFAVVAQHRGGPPLRGGRDPGEVFGEALRKGSALISEPLANRFRVKEGDTIRLQTRAGEWPLEIAAVFFDYSRNEGTVVVDRAEFLKRHPDDGPNSAAIFLPESANVETAREALLQAIGGRWMVDVSINRDLRADVVRVFDRTFAITRALELAAALVAIIAALTVLFALINDRRRDLALLRALGGSRLQVGGLVLAQAGVLGLCGAGSGLASGLVIGWILVKVVNTQSFGWSLQFLPAWTALAKIIGLVVAASLAAGLLPAISALRMAPQEALREE